MACPHFEYYGASGASQKLYNTETEIGEKKVKKNDQKYKVVSRDQTINFPG